MRTDTIRRACHALRALEELPGMADALRTWHRPRLIVRLAVAMAKDPGRTLPEDDAEAVRTAGQIHYRDTATARDRREAPVHYHRTKYPSRR